MPPIVPSSMERRILEYLQDHYPVTVTELAGALHVTEGRVLRDLRKMETRGWVELDALPDKVFVRCLIGLKASR